MRKFFPILIIVGILLLNGAWGEAAAASGNYLITEKGAGGFVLGDGIPDSAGDYEITEETRTIEEGEKITVYVVSENGKKAFEIQPDSPQSYPEIMIFSAEYHTEEGIKVGAAIEDLVKAYPKYLIHYSYLSGMFMFEAEDRSKIQFLLDSKSFVGKQDLMESDWIELSLKDFKPAAKITSIRIYGFDDSESAAKPEDVFVVKDGYWALKSGGEPEGLWGASPELEMYWYAVDPDSEEAAKGLKRGVLLYDAEGKTYSFLPTDKEQTRVENVTFSPDKERMVLSARLNRFASGLWVYEVETLELEKSFWGYSDVWFVDDVRFAFTLVDEKTERPEEAGLWGTSAALYEPAEEKGYVILKGAGATDSFSVTGANESEITINVTSVKSEKDWEDSDKWNESEITVEIPDAG